MNDRSDMHCANEKSMPAGHIVALLFAFLMAGCAGLQKAPVGEIIVKDPVQGAAIAPVPVTDPVAATSPPPAAETPTVAASLDPTLTAPPVPKPVEQPVVKSAVPSNTVPAKALSSPAPAPQPAKSTLATVAKSVTTPPLDMKSLEARLKDTQAIGVFTKIALKNQVNDLLDQFRAYYQGRLKITLADLRRPYEMLLQKVLALLQDGDPPLAGAIVASREAIWGILADPAKFATI